MSAVEPTAPSADERLMRDDIEAWLARYERRELLRLVTIGSVDDGKSTLIGRLLHDTQGVYEDQLASVKKATAKGSLGDRDAGEDIDFALITDGLKAEREQGITIDVAYRYFATPTRKFILADTPGHVQYTRNMATGASTADLAIVLLDARLGVLPQSRRHAFIASLLGIKHLLIAVNKMDLVNWSEEVFSRLKAEFGAFLSGVGLLGEFIPISARRGDNVVTASAKMPWHTGPTVLSHLESVPVHNTETSAPLRFPVQYVLRPNLDYRAFAGQVASGVVRVGDEVVVLPSGRRTRVKSIDTRDGELAYAFAPESVALRLADEVDVSRGEMIAHPGAEPRAAARFDAHVVWMSARALDPQRAYLIKHTTRTVPARVSAVRYRKDLDTLGEVAADTLALNEIGRVTLHASRPIFCDAYTLSRATGAFVLIDALTNDTVAAGMILDATGDEGASDTLRSFVSDAERSARMGQSGAVVWIESSAAAPWSSVVELAAQIERRLFDAGVSATLVDGPAVTVAEVATRCAAAGLIAVCVLSAPAAEAREAVREAVGDGRFTALRETLTDDTVDALVRVVATTARANRT